MTERQTCDECRLTYTSAKAHDLVHTSILESLRMVDEQSGEITLPPVDSGDGT